MKLKCLLIIFLALGWYSNSYAQTEKQFLKAGNTSFAQGEYYEAIAYLSDALKFNKHNDDALYKIAMSYYNLKDYESALPYFTDVKSKEAFPLIDFYLATNYKLLGSYDKAISAFENFRNAYPIPGFYREKANQEIASCYWAKDQKRDPEVMLKQFQKPLNTGFSDFGANYLDSNLIQVSSLQTDKKNMKSDFKSSIYTYDFNGTKINESNRTSFPVAEDSLDYANGFYLPEKEEFYYTQCYTEHEIGEKSCDIYVRKWDDKAWSAPTALNINTQEFTETQPSVSVNKDGETILYFVSNRNGGKGKLDIWMARETAYGEFKDAINLPAPINTIDNESTPFFDEERQSLFFSSEWHYGFGGYDIFRSVLENDNWQNPENLGAPVNSSANDQYYYPTPYNSALFASNREGTMQLRGSACCFDIFEQLFPEESIAKDSIPLITNTLEDSLTKLTTGITALLEAKLPATVYFHNDEPNPKTTKTSTTLSYADCYQDYKMAMPDYLTTFNDETAVNNWFQSVDEAYTELQAFMDLLAIALEEGNDVSLTIEGYCSPLALNDYNINLAKRRISSLENYILSWNGGKLQSYFDLGNLQFVKAPFGEEKADQTISDSTEDVKYSIYDPKAAMERRVAIIAVELE